MPKRRIWSEDEVVVLVALYSISKLQDGDDRSPLNKQIAINFGRTRGQVDFQWRNIRIFQGNGNKGDRSLDGYWGRSSAMVPLCWPKINSEISYEPVNMKNL